MSTANVLVADVCEDFDEEGRIVGKTRRYSQTISILENLHLKPEEIQQQARLELELRRGRSLERDLAVDEEHDESVTSLGQCGLAKARRVCIGVGLARASTFLPAKWG